jgi:hypothetical protein
VFAEIEGSSPFLRHEDEEHLKNALAEAAYTLDYFRIDDLRRGLIEAPPGGQTDLGKPNGKSTAVALASCLYPSDMLDYMPDAEDATRGPADASLLALSDLVGAGGPSLLLLAGDQVYIDATAGLLDPKVSDDRVKLSYQRRGRSRGVLSIAGKLGLRVEAMLDDHEIQDNWAPNDPGLDDDPEILTRAKKYYFRYQHEPTPDGRLYRCFVHDTLPFFLGDTRTERKPRTAEDWRTREIMSPEQRDCLEKWLEAHDGTQSPRFVLTPSALLPRHLAVAEDSACGLLSDSWDGYPASLHRLLAFLCEKQIPGVVFLSGDEHIGNFVTARVRQKYGSKATTFYSIHAPALHAPYPFANATPAEFADTETFGFLVNEVAYECEVETRFPPPGDGFALVTWDPVAKELRLVFHGAAGPKHDQPIVMKLQI